MKEIKTENAVGYVLCHDITQIIKDEKKGVLFKKGHIVKEEDIPLLLSVGKEHGKSRRVFFMRMKLRRFCIASVPIPICMEVISKRARSN